MIIIISIIGVIAFFILIFQITYLFSDEEGRNRMLAGGNYERYKNLPKHHVDFDAPNNGYKDYLEAYRFKLLDYKTLVKVTNEYYEYRKRKYGYFDIAKTIDDKDKIPNIEKIEFMYRFNELKIPSQELPRALLTFSGDMTLNYHNRAYSKEDRFIDLFNCFFGTTYNPKNIIQNIKSNESDLRLYGGEGADLSLNIFNMMIEPLFIKKWELEKVDYNKQRFNSSTIHKQIVAKVTENFLQDITDESKYKLSVVEAYKVFYAIYGVYFYEKYDILDIISEAYLFNDISYKGYCIMRKKCLKQLEESGKDKFTKCFFDSFYDLDKLNKKQLNK